MRPRIYHRHPAIDSIPYGIQPRGYVVELSCGLIKVGHSQRPRGRLESLTGAVRRDLQATITRVHIGPVVRWSARPVECEVLRQLREIAAPAHGCEFFAGIAFEHAAQLVDEASAAQLLKIKAA